MNILIYGAPGNGKTTISRLLHKKIELPIFEGDYIREVIAQSDESEEEQPFIFVGTKQAWRRFGMLNSKNVIKGLKAVRKSMLPYVNETVSTQNNLIFDAAFLDPSKYQSKAKLFLLVTLKEEVHYEHYFVNRIKTKEIEEGFTASRIIQNYLVEEAQKLPVIVIENDSDPEIIVDRIISYL
jgi:2-phosphoglycerate kinase